MEKIGKTFRDLYPNLPTPTEGDLVKMRIDGYNDAEGNLKEFDCPKCKNKGYIMHKRKNELYGYDEEYLTECDCMERRRVLNKARKSGLGSYLNKTFDDFNTIEPWQSSVKEKAIKYVNDDSKKWFIMLGQSGAGKTLICSIIANELLNNRDRTVLYITWTDFIGRLKRDIMSDGSASVSEYLDLIKNVDVLFIDELLKKYNETDLRYIIEIINYRYTAGLQTIVTSERTVSELLDIDEATIGRMIENAGPYITNIGKDRKKNQRLKGLI